MQCLARAVAQSARAAAEGYGGRRFASTGSRGAGAAKAYYMRQRRVALQERMRLAHEQHQLQRILAKLGAIERNLDKLEAPRGIVGFVIRNRFCAVISGVLIAKVLFGSGSSTPSA